MVMNISINKTPDDSVIVKKVPILRFSYLCSRGFLQVIIKKKKFLLIKTIAHKKKQVNVIKNNWCHQQKNNSPQGGRQGYTSLILYLRLSGQFQVCLLSFFYRKVLNAQKHVTTKKTTNKTKTSEQKNQRHYFLARTKTSKRVKIVCCAFWCFFYAQNLFVKKQTELKLS